MLEENWRDRFRQILSLVNYVSSINAIINHRPRQSKARLATGVSNGIRYAFSYRPRKFLRRLMALNSLAHHLIPAPCMQRRPIPREIDSITTRALHLSPCPCVLGVPCPGITVNAISTRSRPRSKSRIATMLEYRSCVNILPRTTRKCHRKSSSFARFSRLLLFPFQRFVPGQSIKYNDSSFAFVFFFLSFCFFFDPRKYGCVRFFHSRLC